MRNNKTNLILILLLVIATIGTLYFTIGRRIEVELNSNQVEIIIDYARMLEIEDFEKTTMAEWFKVATNDEEEKYTITLKSDYLKGYADKTGIYYATVSETKNSLVAGLINEQILDIINNYDDEAILIKTAKLEDKEYLENAFSFYRFLNVKTYEFNNDYYFIVDHGFNDSKELDTIPLGFSKEYVDNIKNIGAKLSLRPLNYKHDVQASFDLYVSEVEKHDMDSEILFFENEVLGYDRSEEGSILRSADYIRENNLTFQVVESAKLSENIMLEGYDELIDELGLTYVVRMFNVWDYIATKYQYLGIYKGAEEIENTIYRAVSERNNRAVVLNIIRNKSNTKYITDPLVYQDMLTSLETRLEKQGIYYGNATPFGEITTSTGLTKNSNLIALLTIQVVFSIVILINMIFGNLNTKINVLLSIVGIIGTFGLSILSKGLFIDIMSLASGISLSTIAVLYYVKYVLWVDESASDKNILLLILNFIVTIIIAMIGGLIISSYKSSLEFLLVFETFRGVKLSLVAPIGLLIIALTVYFVKQVAQINNRSIKDTVVTTTTTFLNLNIKMYYVIIAGFVAMLGLLYILRSGNTGASPLSIEFIIRNYFENNLFARPRNKELFMAIPMMVVGIAFIRSKLVQKNIYTKFIYITIISMSAVIETTSIINTFSHRTPLDMSIYRTIMAGVLGTVLGLIYALGIYVFILIIKKINEKYKLVG